MIIPYFLTERQNMPTIMIFQNERFDIQISGELLITATTQLVQTPFIFTTNIYNTSLKNEA